MKLSLFPNLYAAVPYYTKTDYFTAFGPGLYHYVFSFECESDFKKVDFFAGILFEGDEYCIERKNGPEGMFSGQINLEDKEQIKIIMKQDSGMLIKVDISRFSIWKELT